MSRIHEETHGIQFPNNSWEQQKPKSIASKITDSISAMKELAVSTFSGKAESNEKPVLSNERVSSTFSHKHLEDQLDKLNQMWIEEKKKGTEASQRRMNDIAYAVAAITGHLGAQGFHKSTQRLEDDLAEISLKIRLSYRNVWGKTIAWTSVAISMAAATMVFSRPIDAILQARGVAAPMAEGTHAMLATASQPVGTAGTTLSSTSQLSEKDNEAIRLELQHTQGVYQRSLEDNKGSRQKANESTQHALRNKADAGAAYDRIVEKMTQGG